VKPPKTPIYNSIAITSECCEGGPEDNANLTNNQVRIMVQEVDNLVAYLRKQIKQLESAK